MKTPLHLLYVLLFGITAGYGQCVNDSMFPFQPIVLNNSGSAQMISNCNWTSEYAYLMNVDPTIGYIFTCNLLSNIASDPKYITITNLQNEVLAHGPSPLTVSNLAANEIRVHYTENDACEISYSCHSTTVQAVVSCMPPSSVAVSNISSTSATVTWTQPQDINNFEVFVVNMNNPNPIPDSILPIAVTGNTYTATNLLPATVYQIAVRSVCENETGPIMISSAFVTPCEATATLEENFDDDPAYQLPSCWQSIRRGSGISGHASIQVNYAQPTTSGINALQFLPDGSNLTTADLIAVTPEFINLATNNRLRFNARGGESIQVGTLNNNGIDAVFTPIQSFDLTNEMQSFTVDFANYAGTDKYIGFRLSQTQGFDPTYIDDVIWEANPLCADITSVEVTSIGENTATIAFEAFTAVGGYEISIATGNVENPEAGTIVNSASNTFTFSDLEPSTTYKIWVRTSCANVGTGYWSAPITVTTTCAQVTSFFEDFNDETTLPLCWSSLVQNVPFNSYSGVYLANYTNIANDNGVYLYQDFPSEDMQIMLLSPAVSNLNTGLNRVKFKGLGQGVLAVGTLSGTGANAVFTPVQEFTLTLSPENYTVNFPASNSNENTIAFRIDGVDVYTYAFLDNIRYEAIPPCGDVLDIAISNATTTQANINFTAVAGAIGYDVSLSTTNQLDENAIFTLETNSGIIPNLQPNTNYYVFVRSRCSADAVGQWSEAVLFSSGCEIVSSFVETFENASYNSLPNCWSSIISGADVSPFSAVQTYQIAVGTGNDYVGYMYNDSAIPQSDSNVILVSPRVNSLGTGTHRVRFTAYGFGNLVIGTLSSNDSSAVFTPIQTLQLGELAQNIYTASFNTNTTDEFIGFKIETNEYYSYVVIDNIYLETMPDCPDAMNITVVDFNEDEIDLTWEGNNNNGGTIVYSTELYSDPSSLTNGVSATTNEVTIENLESSTTYYFWVQTTCANGSGAWMGPVIGTTDCATTEITDASAEGFDYLNGGMPYCWSAELNFGAAQWHMYEPNGEGAVAEAYSGSTIAYKNADTGSAVLYANPLDYTEVNEATRVSVYLHRHEDAHDNDMYRVYVNSERTMEGAMLLGTIHSKNSIEPAVEESGFYNYRFDIPQQMNGSEAVYVMIEGATADLNLSQGLGIDDFIVEYAEALSVNNPTDSDAFRLYPNPATTVLNVNAASTIENVRILNTIGQVVLEQNINNTSSQIDISNLAAGAYLIQLKDSQKTITKKFIKQ